MSLLNHSVARRAALLLGVFWMASAVSIRAEVTVDICTQAELELKISQARTNGGDGVVRFNCDGTILLTNTIMLRASTNSLNTNSIILDASGRSITISGQSGTNLTSQSRLFQLESRVQLAVVNLAFINGQSTNGAAFFVAPQSELLAVSCTFSNNVVHGSNGLAGASARTTTVDGKGSGGRNGTAAATGGGGAIYNLGYAELRYCTFLTNGVFAGNGGAGGNGGNGTVRGGDGGFGGRGGAAMGGAIYNQGRLFTTNCAFYGNFALGGVGGGGGTAGTGVFGGLEGRGAAGGAAAGGAIYNHPKSFAGNINTTFAINVTDSGDSALGGSNQGRGKTGAGGPHASGGAIANLGTNMLLNCTFYANGANAGEGGNGSTGSTTGGRGGNGGSAWGGNVFNGKKATLIATHCTISDGGAVPGTNGMAGSGILAGRDGDRGLSRGANIANSNGVFTLRNSIVAYPSNGTNGYYTGKAFTFAGRNISSDRSFKPLSVPKTNVTLLLTNLDPRLGTLQRNGGAVETIRLLDDSPAINMGATNFGLPLDARGVGRPSTTNVDLGAYEHGIGLVPPTIVSQPQDATVVRGNTVVFTVTAQGDPPFIYQWRKNGAVISTATSSTLIVTNAQISNEGSYDVVVSNNSGSVESDDASLNVAIPATITSQPSGLILAPGGTATFSVTAEGDAPLQYQWFHNGAAVLGAIRGSFTVTNAFPVENGEYYVQVSNPYRTTESFHATLVVTSVPPTIVTAPTNITVLGGHTASFTASANGTLPFTFVWYLVKNGTTNLQDFAQSYDATNTFAIRNAQPTNEGSYFVVVTNYGGRATSALATLTVQLVVPLITRDVEDQVVAAWDDAHFSFGAFGSKPMTFQWYSNQTVLLPGATNFSLTITNLSTNGSGTYTIVASNSAGTVTSRVASVIVTNVAPTLLLPPEHTFATRGEDATFSVTPRGSRPFYFQWHYDGEAITNATNATLTVTDIDMDATLGVYSVAVTNELGIVTSEDVQLYLLEPIEVDCDGQTCDITMPGVDEDNVEFKYTLQFRASPDDAWLGVETLPDDEEEEVRLLFQYTPQPYNADSAAYRVVITTAGPEGEPFLDLEPEDVSVVDGQDAVFTVSSNSSEPVSYRWYFNDTLLVGETRSTLVIANAQPEQAGGYHVVAHGIFGATTSVVATLTVVTDPAPALIEQPANASLFSGENATFAVTVFGASPLTYQWYLNGTNLIAGVNFSALVVSNAQTVDAGSYHVVVSNRFGVVTSGAASLSISNLAPTVNVLPQQDVQISIGDSFTFTVGAIGSRPLTYQWFISASTFGGPEGPILGATNASYTVTVSSELDRPQKEGVYWVEITNPLGTTSTDGSPSLLDVFP